MFRKLMLGLAAALLMASCSGQDHQSTTSTSDGPAPTRPTPTSASPTTTTTESALTTTSRPATTATTSATNIPDQVIHVEALIDGRSALWLSASSVSWFHLDWAAPGLHEGANEPTRLNGVDWIPVWPESGDHERVDCMCQSEPTTELGLALPSQPISITLEPHEARGLVCIDQLPAPENGWTLVVEFDDNPFSGSVTYELDIQIVLITGQDPGTANGWDCDSVRSVGEDA